MLIGLNNARYPTRGHLTVHHLETMLFPAFDRLGLAADVIKPVRDTVTHLYDLQSAARTAPDDLSDRAGEVAIALATSVITIDKAVDAITGHASAAAAADAVVSMLEQAGKIALNNAIGTAQQAGPRLLEVLDAECLVITKAAVKERDRLGLAATLDQAVKLGRQSAGAWATLASLADRLKDVQQLADALRGYVLADHRPDRNSSHAEYHYAHPFRLPRADLQPRRAFGAMPGPVVELLGVLDAEPREFSHEQWQGRVPQLQGEYHSAFDAENRADWLADAQYAAARSVGQ